MTVCEWRSRASARISRVRKRVEGVACDEGEIAVHMPSDGEEGGLRCSERVGVRVENGYYGSVRAEAMMAEAVRFYVVPSGSFWLLLVPSGSFWLLLAPSGSFWFLLVLCGWRQVRGLEMVGDSEGRVERRECVDGVRGVCTCWTRELEWIVLSAEVGVKSV